jgi:hypothetical protein
LKAHLASIAATDFSSAEVLTRGGLVRYFVLFVIDIETRRVQIAGIVRQRHGAWMKQIARNRFRGARCPVDQIRVPRQARAARGAAPPRCHRTSAYRKAAARSTRNRGEEDEDRARAQGVLAKDLQDAGQDFDAGAEEDAAEDLQPGA